MLVPFVLTAATPVIPPIVPKPAFYWSSPGVCMVTARSSVSSTGASGSVGRLFAKEMRLKWAGSSRGVIVLRIDPTLERLGPEGYRLVITRSGIVLASAAAPGLFYATRTLRQVMSGTGGRWTVPCATIEDQPRFAWRGAHIDVARHFMPIRWLRKLVDLLAMQKMNVLHLHLTDDQGWRLEIKRYPKLTEVGSKRTDSQINDRPDQYEGKPHSGFYTQEEMRSLVAYASERNVAILPEIEMPGHSQAAVASYPELGNTGRPVQVATDWGTHDETLNVEDSTIRFFEGVLDEVMGLFPSKFVHIGGDEAPKGPWKSSARAQARMKELGLTNEEQLQSWFIRQMDTYLTGKGRRLIGWDEILQGGLAPGAAVMSWRGESGGISAANSGHDVVMAPLIWTYLDQAQTKDPKLEMSRPWGYLSLERAYKWDPMPAGIAADAAHHVLGGESALWTEVIADPATAEYMLFPRLCALAEALWSPKGPRNYAEFRLRLAPFLSSLGVRHHPIDPISAPRVGGWGPGQIGTEFASRDWDVTGQVGGAGVYECTLQYFGGDNRLDIRRVDLLEDGLVVASDVHDGATGADDRANRYRLSLVKRKVGSRYTLRATVRADGGTDSFGDVSFKFLGERQSDVP